jgi:hypothetical protein
MFNIEYFIEVVYNYKNNRLKEKFIKDNFKDFYNFINNDFSGNTFLEKIFVFYKGDHKCYCGKETKFISFSKGYLEYCSISCSSNDKKTRDKYKKTCLENWGVTNVSMSNDIKKKKENYFYEKYGVTTYLQSESIKNKMISKWGVDNPFKLKEIQEKIKKTNFNKYGSECVLLSSEIIEKTKKTNIEKWGVNHYSKTEDWKIKMKKINDSNYIESLDLSNNYQFISKNSYNNIIKHIDCGNEFEIQTQLIRLRKNRNVEICKHCNKINHFSENDLHEYITSIYSGKVIQSYRDGLEIDIYLPELKLGFEFNGLYWHCELFKDRKYHKNKNIFFNEKGIRIINIWEDDWLHKTEVIKSIIKSNIGIFENTIYARKCTFYEISDKECKEFLHNNHIQGWCVSKYRYALSYNGEIVSILTVGKERLNLGYSGEKSESQLEIIRFCNKLNTKIIGGFSKLFKNLIKNVKFKKITTYSDSSIFTGDVYAKNGFSFIGQTEPGYSYIVNGIRKNRFNFNKSKLIKMGFDKNKTESEIMFDNNFYRIYDCGNYKFEIIF